MFKCFTPLLNITECLITETDDQRTLATIKQKQTTKEQLATYGYIGMDI